MTKSRHIIRPKHRWTADDDETLRLNYAMWPAFLIAYLVGCSVSAVYNRAAAIGLKKSPNFWQNPYAHLWRGEVTEAVLATRIKPGSVPHNKGLRRPGWAPGRMAQTQFKRGQLCGAAARRLVPVGTEVVDPDGYLKRKIRDDAPANLSRQNWAFVHVLVWEEHNGPVPAGHAITFRNGSKADVRIENLELVSRGELMSRNTIHRYPEEIVSAMRLRGKLVRKISDAEKKAKP